MSVYLRMNTTNSVSMIFILLPAWDMSNFYFAFLIFENKGFVGIVCRNNSSNCVSRVVGHYVEGHFRRSISSKCVGRKMSSNKCKYVGSCRISWQTYKQVTQHTIRGSPTFGGVAPNRFSSTSIENSYSLRSFLGKTTISKHMVVH